MLRLCLRPQSRHNLRFTNHRLLTSSTSSGNNPYELPTHQHQHLSSQSSILPQPLPSALTPPDAPPSLGRKSVFALSATLLAAAIGYAAVIQPEERDSAQGQSTSPLYSAVESSLHKSNDSLKRIYRHLKHTGAAASVLWQSLRSVLSSANQEVRAGFELRVAALLADISAANANRRSAIVGAGGGAVVDWLLETVSSPRDGCRTQAESARALAYLIADPGVCEVVLGRPHAVPNLLRFIFSCQPQRSKKQTRRSSFDLSDSLKGRSMLVAAIMDIVTSNCDVLDTASIRPILPNNAIMRDIAAAIQVIEEGGLHMDPPQHDEDDEDDDKGLKGIGIKIIEGTTVLGLARTNVSDGNSPDHEGPRDAPKHVLLHNKYSNSLPKSTGSSAVVPGLWDDLHYEHVAVPFAAWALANWAMASEANRSHIQELDQDGNAIMTALMAPERSVKWHGSLVARLLLEDHNLPLNDSVPDWSSCLLSTGSHATKNDDIPLAQAALSAFLVSVERSPNAQKVVMEKGLHLLREMSKNTTKHRQVQEILVKAVELLFTCDMHLSLDESQRWSGILLRWVSGGTSCDTVRSSAMTILSRILEDHGPLSVPISQSWLAVLLSEIVGSNKPSSAKGSAQPRNDKVKAQIDQSNMHSAGQFGNQLASAVVTLARNQVGSAAESVDTFPLADLLSLEPFVLPMKNLKKDSQPKINAADSALATLRAVKALTGVCIQDASSQEKLTQLGILCLLRRFLLRDDYEKLAAIEAYDASRAPEAQERAANGSPESSSTTLGSDTSSLRVTPTAHIRRHAARLLTILSLLPKVQKVILEDEAWCKWLEDCARGEVPGCSDLKIQSYARATLLNISCNDQITSDPKSEHASGEDICPRYGDALFLINPELPHWNCSNRNTSSSDDSINDPVERAPNGETSGNSLDVSHQSVEPSSPSLDVVFVHGLRGGPYKTWRISEDKSSTKSGLVEKIDQEAGKQGTFWPGEWLSNDFPEARMFSIKYKTNLTQWSGASLPLQEVSSMLLHKLVAAGIGNRPVVFVTHSMGGLVVKQMLFKAKSENIDNLVNNTVGVVFYSCPHFGSKLADMPWRMGLVLRPAPTIGELRSGSPILVELNDFIRQFHKKGMLDVLSFCETKVTPIVEGYGGWAFRMEIVPIESAYPGFGELVVLESTDHINSCKPLSRTDPSYTETLAFLQKLKSHYT